MADPKPDRRDVDEAKEALRSLVVTGGDTAGVLQLVEAPFDKVSKTIQGPVDCSALFSLFAHGNDGQDIAFAHGFSNAVSVIASVGQQNTRCRQIVGHDQIEAEVVGGLPRGDLRPHRQPCCIDEEVDLGRKATARTAKTLSRSPPLAPAA